jgi:hypothetical protein
MKTNMPMVADHAVMDLDTGISATTDDAFKGLKSTDRAVREEILHRAYAIWECEGHPHGRGLANWLEAEAEVMAAACPRAAAGAVARDPQGSRPPRRPRLAWAGRS